MRLAIFGPQGAGKGTQALRISEKYGIPSISTGEIFRWAVAGKTALGLRVLEHVNAGKLVPNDLTIQVVRERLAAEDVKDGFIVDGFPRNTVQAEALDELLAEQGCGLDAALVIDVPQEVSVRRILGRMACVRCGRNYSIESPPEKPGVCDKCSGEVVRRTDDVDERTVLSRLDTYHRETEPLKVYYDERGLLREVSGEGSPEEVFARIVAVL